MISNTTIVSNNSDLPLYNNFIKKTPIPALAQKILGPNANHWITPGNMERVTLAVGAAIAASAALASYIFSKSIGAILSSVITSIAAPILPISLMATAGYIALRSYNIRDYDNPLELSKYQEETKSMSLEETLKKNGSNTGKILTQEQFIEKYIEETKKIDNIPDLQKYYSKLIPLTNESLKLPCIKEYNQQRLQEACSSLSFNEAIQLHGGFSNVYNWRLLSPKQRKENREAYQKHIDALKSQYGIK